MDKSENQEWTFGIMGKMFDISEYLTGVPGFESQHDTEFSFLLMPLWEEAVMIPVAGFLPPMWENQIEF